LVLDRLADNFSVRFEQDRHVFRADVKYKGRTLVLIKPTTYMNRSGKAVNYWLQHEKIPLQNLLVIVDELALPFGSIRIKTRGSDGGHNGLKHIQDTLGTTHYARLRFGIGNDYPKGQQVNYVLSPWSDQEISALKPRVEQAVEAIKTFVLAGPAVAMNQHNKS
jgi:PTH1 family peptidyl-tRNA hydrolase